MKKYLILGFTLLTGIISSAIAGPVLFFGIQPTSLEVSFGANNKSYTLQFYIVNNAPVAQPLANFQITQTNPSPKHSIVLNKVTYSTDPNTPWCLQKILPQGSTGWCNIYATFPVTGNQYGSSQFITPETYQFSLKYGAAPRTGTLTSNNFTISYATGKTVTSANRTFNFVNNCTYPVTLGIASGATNSINPVIPGDLQSCNNDNDCYPNSKCIVVDPIKKISHCFWNNPAPANNQYTLAKNGGTNSVVFPTYDNGIDAIWSGGIAGRTNCVNGVCETGDCGAATPGTTGACKLGQGFSQPVTAAEFTLNGSTNLITNVSGNNDVDTYDATVINGITVPVSMGPTNGTWGGASNPYTCGTPGAAKSQAPLGICSWQFTPPINDYIWVRFAAGAQSCTSNAVCPAGQVCGLSYNPAAPAGSKLNKKCGVQLGYWTADAICAADSSYNVAPFNCSSLVQGNLTYADLYGCASGALKQSCYSAGAANTCCGCVNWNTIPGIIVPAPPVTGACINQNTKWTTYSQPKLQWVKKGCPTAYVYPYDDMSSTFTCQVLNSNKVNVTNYTVTFCPK